MNPKEQTVEFMSSNTDVFELLNVTEHQVLFDLFCCFTPKYLKKNENNLKASMLWLYDTVKRNLCDDYCVKMSEKCIQIFECYDDENEQKENYGKLECVSMYIEEKKIENKSSKNKMDVDEHDDDCSEHKHENAMSVRIIYPHNMTETAALVQSLVNMTCDSYC